MVPATHTPFAAHREAREHLPPIFVHWRPPMLAACSGSIPPSLSRLSFWSYGIALATTWRCWCLVARRRCDTSVPRLVPEAAPRPAQIASVLRRPPQPDQNSWRILGQLVLSDPRWS